MAARKVQPMRRINNEEFQAKRVRGLCFRCDEKYHIGHRCKNKETRELRVLLVDDIEKIEITQEEFEEEAPGVQNLKVDTVEKQEIGDLVELDLKSDRVLHAGYHGSQRKIEGARCGRTHRMWCHT